MNNYSLFRRIFAAGIFVLAAQWSGVALAQGDEIDPTATILEIPEEPGEATVAVGETIVARAEIYTYRGIELLKPIEARQRGGSGAGRPSVVIQPQYMIARSADSKWIYFTGNVIYKQGGVTNMTGELGTGGHQNRVGGLRFRKDDPAEMEIWVRQHRGRGFYIEEPPEFREATIGAGGDQNGAIELAYGGRDGDTLKIYYREHAGAAEKPAVEEAVDVSLSDGTEFSVRGARVEVLEATADSLRYRVLKNFE